MGIFSKMLIDGSEEGEALGWVKKKLKEKKAREEAEAQASANEAKSGVSSLFGSDDEDKKDE